MTPSTADKAPRTPRWPGALVWALAWLFMFLLQPVLDLANLGMLLVLAAALAALWWPPLASLAACALAVLLFNFSFVPPLGTFTVDLHQHALLLVTMLSVSWMVALLMVRQRRLAEAERLLAQRARQLQEFGERLRDADKPRERAPELTAVLTALAHRPVRLLLQGDACPPEGEAPSEVWEGLCTCLKEGQALGPGTGRHEELDAWFLPLRGRRTGLGAAWLPLDSMPQGDRVALRAHAQALCDQMGLALERAATAQVAATAREEAASHSLRNTLLAAISHDYRTPLATILGAASSLHDQDDRLSPAQRRRLAATIIDGSQPAHPIMPIRNITAYSRKPLAQPSAAARAIRAGMSSALVAWRAPSATACAAPASTCRPSVCSHCTKESQSESMANVNPSPATTACACSERPARLPGPVR